MKVATYHRLNVTVLTDADTPITLQLRVPVVVNLKRSISRLLAVRGITKRDLKCDYLKVIVTGHSLEYGNPRTGFKPFYPTKYVLSNIN